MAGAFDYRQAEEIRDVFARHEIRYLFIAANRAKDRESLPRLRDFRDYWKSRH
ncbi:MAG TPA: hypothetical protein VGQ46_13770 [Thermoanaerobaculia bacterium]|jgi:hypothetical protein|nr:hypothetical protein [Thermoanaerobaculia bacterium]